MNTNNDEYEFVPVTAEDAEDAIREADEAKGMDDKFITLPEGETVLRLLPLPKGHAGFGKHGHPWAIRFVHYVKPRAEGAVKMVRVLCSRLMGDGPCPACELLRELASLGLPPPPEGGDAKMEVLYSAIKRGQENLGPRILKAGSMLHEDIQRIVKQSRGMVMDPTARGMDIVIDRTGQKRDTRYKVLPSMTGSVALGDPSWLTTQHDLGAELRADKTFEQIRDALAALALTAGANRRPPPTREAPARAVVTPARELPATREAPARAVVTPARVVRASRSAQDIAEDE